MQCLARRSAAWAAGSRVNPGSSSACKCQCAALATCPMQLLLPPISSPTNVAALMELHRLAAPCSAYPAACGPTTLPLQAIDLKECDVYSYRSDGETDPFGESHSHTQQLPPQQLCRSAAAEACVVAGNAWRGCCIEPALHMPVRQYGWHGVSADRLCWRGAG